MSFNDRIYSGAAQVGKVELGIGAIISSIVGILFGVIGLYLLMLPTEQVVVVKGTVINSPKCTSNINSDKSTITTCEFDVEYKDNQNNVFKHSFVTDKIVNAGETIDIEYSPINPNNSRLCCTISNKISGGIFLVVGLLFFFGAIYSWYMKDYEFKAASTAITSTTAGLSRAIASGWR